MSYLEKHNFKQNGGLKLGQGGFGCVVGPAISCHKKQLPKNAVSKITYILPGYETDYQSELKMMNVIKKIDPQQKYFVSVNDECKLNLLKINSRNPKDIVEVSYEDDNLETFYVKPSEPKYISRMSAKDITKKYCLVDEYLEPRNQILEFGGYSLYNITPDKYPELYQLIRRNYKNVIRNLLLGLQLLHSNRIAHRDIKEDNILGIIIKSNPNISKSNRHQNKTYKKNTKQKNNHNVSRKKISHPLVRYIDFGLAEQISPNWDEGGIKNFHWSGTNGYIPIEFVLLHYMEDDYINKYGGINMLKNDYNKQKIIMKTQERYNKSYKRFYDDIHVEHSLMITSSSREKKDRGNQPQHQFFDYNKVSKIYDELVNSLSNGTFYKLMKTDYTGLLYKADIFALGITLAFFRIHFRLQSDKKMADLITKMVKLNPMSRPSIKDCLQHKFMLH